MVDLIQFLSCAWPILLGLLLATIIAWGLPLAVLRKMSPTHKWTITVGITLVMSIIAFVWHSFLLIQVRVVFASLGSHGRVISHEFDENLGKIHRELWLREIVPPSVQIDCFSASEVCSLIETVSINTAEQRPYSQQKPPILGQWINYFMQFLFLGVPVGLATGWVQYRLIQQRL